MNRYLQSIGFPENISQKRMYEIIQEGMRHPVKRAYTVMEEDEETLCAQFDFETGVNIGISVCGQFDENDTFHIEQYFPYLDAGEVSTIQSPCVEEGLDNMLLCGCCEDDRVNERIVFHVQNTVEYWKNKHVRFLPLEKTTVSFAALALEGTILLPVYNSPKDIEEKEELENAKRRLYHSALSGDMEDLVKLRRLEMQQYRAAMCHIQNEDVLTAVESYFVSCSFVAQRDLYQVIGVIETFHEEVNSITEEPLYCMQVVCNGLKMEVVIRQNALSGEPKKGRRFKGSIWLQGKINFPLKTDYPESTGKQQVK